MAKENYSKARLAEGNGDFQDVHDVSWQADDGIQQLSTLRRNPSGEVQGKRSSTITYKMWISEDGFERDILGQWNKFKRVQLRLKIPGKTITQTGRYSKPQITNNVDGAIEFQITHVGTVSF